MGASARLAARSRFQPISVQAGVALHLARERGEAPPPALVAVEEAAEVALRRLY